METIRVIQNQMQIVYIQKRKKTFVFWIIGIINSGNFDFSRFSLEKLGFEIEQIDFVRKSNSIRS